MIVRLHYFAVSIRFQNIFYVWLHWVSTAVCGLSLVAMSVGLPSRCGAWASHCSGWQALERRLSSCGPQAQLPSSMCNLPRPGIKPVSPALAGEFLTTGPPGKSLLFLIWVFLRDIREEAREESLRDVLINGKEGISRRQARRQKAE